MNEAILPTGGLLPTTAKQRVPSVALPKPQPLGAPVLIADAVTPLAGETLLSLLMKRMQAQADARLDR